MAVNDWKKFIVPEKELLTPGRFPTGLYSFGPDELNLRENIIQGGGPDEFVRNNPQLFATSSTSRPEGYAYWALLHIMGPEGQVGRNGGVWYYQSKVSPFGRAGSAVVDFVIEGVMDGWDIGVRITSYFHTTGSEKQADDFAQISFLIDQGIYPVDVEADRLISDDTGKAAIMLMQEALDANPDIIL